MSSLPTALQLRLELTFSIRNAASFQACLNAINDPHSPFYHDFLTNATLEPYIPTPGQKSSVVNYLESKGFNVTDGPSPLTLSLISTVGVAESLFGTRVDVFSTGGSSRFYGPTSNPLIPESFASLISDIQGLDNYSVIEPTESPCSGPYCPQGIQVGYSLSGLYSSGYDGTGQTVAIVDAPGDPNIQSAVNTFDAQYGLPSTTLTVLYPDGSPTSWDPGWASETAMDVEAVHTTAPGAQIVVLYDTGDLVDSIDYVASHDLANVVSNSWSYGAIDDSELSSSLVSSVDSRLAMDSAQGLTILFATGDAGARPDGTNLGTEFPASDPNVLAVGATNLFLSDCGTTTCSGYSSETGAVISGGGYSGYFAEPSWQKTAIGSVSGRAVPDVSMMGYYPNFWVYSTASDRCGTSGTTSAGWFGCAGTSLSTPLWAGLMVIIVQAKGGGALGNFAPSIWQLASSSSYSNDFHDIISGSNNGYSAGSGWDPVTGWGTPVASNLVTSLITKASFDTNLDAASDIAGSTPILTVTVGGTGSTCTGGSKTTVTHSMLPYSTAGLAAGTDVCYSYVSPVASTTTGKQYSWTSISAATGSASGQSGQSGSFTIASSSAVTAAYQTQYFLTVSVSPSGAGTTTPSSEWINAGSTVSITAAPGSGSSFSGWSCTGSGCYSQAANPTPPITMNNPITETANFETSTSALSLDGSTSGGVNLGTTVSVSLTTSCSPDVIIVLIGENTARATATTSIPTSPGLTFTLRASLLSGTMRVWEYYAIASSPLKSQAVTEVVSQPTAYTLTALGVCGANTAAPFDTNPSLPKTAGGFFGTSHSNTVTTSNPNDLIIDFDASQGNPTYTPLNGYSSVVTQEVSSWMASSAEYKVVSSTQSGTSLGFTLSLGESGSQTVDAVVSASSSSVTISGPPPPSTASNSVTVSKAPEASLSRAPSAPSILMTKHSDLTRSMRLLEHLTFLTGYVSRPSPSCSQTLETSTNHISAIVEIVR